MIRNPCLDPAKLTLVSQVNMPAFQVYTLFENAPIGVQIESKSLLKLEPAVCMDGLKYTVTLNG